MQSAIDRAMPGDIILLQAGVLFTGDLVLPATAGATYITIRSSAPDGTLPGPGQRTGPAYAASLPKIQAQFGPVVRTAPGAHHWRFENVEFLPNPDRGNPIVVLGALDNSQTTLGQVPHDLIFDRIFMHDEAGGSKRGIQANSASTQIINSYISGIRRIGQEAQAISLWNGPGPLLIDNNYLEAAGENVLVGGADPDISNLIPSDITVRRNYMTKPVAWRSQGWSVKNVFELKNAQRVTIDGNIFENSWTMAQNGYIILFQGLNDGGRCTWCTVRDVTFTNNVVRHGNGGMQLAGHVAYNGAAIGPASSNLVVRNNLFYDISTTWDNGTGPLGRCAQMSAEYQRLTYEHNTCDNDGTMAIFLGSFAGGAYEQLTGLSIRNNLMRGSTYGVFGDTAGSGTAALIAYTNGNYTFLNNVIASDASPAAGGAYPASTLLPTVGTFSAAFVNRGGGNYRLTGSSSYKRAASDGTDIGVNVDALPDIGAQSAPPATQSASAPHAPGNVRIAIP